MPIRKVPKPNTRKKKEDINDLGFGTQLTKNGELRFLNQDGSFNVERIGLSPLESLHIYHSLLTMSWLRFHFVIAIAYVLLNIIFAVFYLKIEICSLQLTKY